MPPTSPWQPVVWLAHVLLRKDAFRRFVLVGLLNTIVGYSIFTAGVLAGIDSAIALFLANCFAVLFNFFTTGILVFANRDLRLLPRFVVAYCLTYCANLVALRILEGLGIATLLAQLLCLGPVVVMSFLIFKFLVFRNRAGL